MTTKSGNHQQSLKFRRRFFSSETGKPVKFCFHFIYSSETSETVVLVITSGSKGGGGVLAAEL
jgi:hypothetical protein